MPNLEWVTKEILERAMEDDLVSPASHLADPDPHARTSEELAGVVEILKRFAREVREAD